MGSNPTFGSILPVLTLIEHERKRMPKKQGMLPNQTGSGGWDQRRGGTVDNPEHNLSR